MYFSENPIKNALNLLTSVYINMPYQKKKEEKKFDKNVIYTSTL